MHSICESGKYKHIILTLQLLRIVFFKQLSFFISQWYRRINIRFSKVHITMQNMRQGMLIYIAIHLSAGHQTFLMLLSFFKKKAYDVYNVLNDKE